MPAVLAGPVALVVLALVVLALVVLAKWRGARRRSNGWNPGLQTDWALGILLLGLV